MRDKELERRVARLERKVGHLGWECAACRRFLPMADVTVVQKMIGNTVQETFMLCAACDAAVKDAK